MKLPLPFINRVLIFLVLLTAILHFGRPVLVPFSFAILFAMLMTPLCKWLDSKNWPRALSCLASVAVILVILLGMLFIIIAQVSSFAGDLTQLGRGTNELLHSAQQFIERKFDVPAAEQSAFLHKQTQELGKFVKDYVTAMIRDSAQLLASIIITLVLTFLLLFHREKYFKFFLHIAGDGAEDEKKKMLHDIGHVAQHYLIGRAISIIALFVLYAIALLVIGIENALLLAAVAALFNIIPYLGPILAALFPFFVALVTEPSYQPAIWVLVSFCAFQALDNYWITPYYLGGEVSLSALATIVAILCGGFLWGIPGMILFIPMLSIVKIICDHVPGLEPYGEVIGDTGQKPSRKLREWISKIFGGKK